MYSILFYKMLTSVGKSLTLPKRLRSMDLVTFWLLVQFVCLAGVNVISMTH